MIVSDVPSTATRSILWSKTSSAALSFIDTAGLQAEQGGEGIKYAVIRARMAVERGVCVV